MKVTYLNHSGFLLQTETANFLFDYYKGKIPELNRELPLVVFVSHKHGDHYNPEIFELVRSHPSILYIVSKDVPVKWQIQKYKELGIELESHILVVRKNIEQQIMLPDGRMLFLETFKSTDEGVAYFFSYEGKNFYHAGDLNWWIWAGESKQYNENMTKAYFRELEKIKGREIHIAFVPLDPRQEEDAFCGMESFLEYTETKTVFPMHFWDDFSIIGNFLEKHPEYMGKVMKIECDGQGFRLF